MLEMCLSPLKISLLCTTMAHRNSITSCHLSQLFKPDSSSASLLKVLQNNWVSLWVNGFHRGHFQNGAAWSLTSNTSDPVQHRQKPRAPKQSSEQNYNICWCGNFTHLGRVTMSEPHTEQHYTTVHYWTTTQRQDRKIPAIYTAAVSWPKGRQWVSVLQEEQVSFICT